MKPRWHEIVVRALENGAQSGWYRAHKHDDSPGEETILDEIVRAQLDALDEFIEFDESVT